MTRSSKVLFIFLLTSVVLQSCVDRISIPDTEESKLVLHCEMTRYNPVVVAYLSTSDNLNGSRPIDVPEDASIEISTGTENSYRLLYDEELDAYTNSAPFLWSRVNNLTIVAELPTDDFPVVKGQAKPMPAYSVESVTSTNLQEVAVEQETFYERDVTITLTEPTVKPAYFELELTELFSTLTIEDGEEVIAQSGERMPVTVVAINNGGVGMINMSHRPGLLIDHSRLVDNTFSIKVRSAFPITSDDQVFGILSTQINSISKDYYLYHKAYSNTVKATAGQYSDPAIWNSNIEDGFGLFAVKTSSGKDFPL